MKIIVMLALVCISVTAFGADKNKSFNILNSNISNVVTPSNFSQSVNTSLTKKYKCCGGNVGGSHMASCKKMND